MRNASPGWLATGSFVVLAATASSLVTSAVQQPRTAPPLPAADARDIAERVAALLATHREAAGPVAADTNARATDASSSVERTERTRATPSNFELRLQALEEGMQRLSDVLASVPRAAPIPRNDPVDYHALAALHARANEDRDAAQQSTVFLTPHQAVQRFGSPDEIGPANGADFYWTYRAPPGSDQGGMMLVFRSGYVAWHELR